MFRVIFEKAGRELYEDFDNRVTASRWKQLIINNGYTFVKMDFVG